MTNVEFAEAWAQDENQVSETIDEIVGLFEDGTTLPEAYSLIRDELYRLPPGNVTDYFCTLLLMNAMDRAGVSISSDAHPETNG